MCQTAIKRKQCFKKRTKLNIYIFLQIFVQKANFCAAADFLQRCTLACLSGLETLLRNKPIYIPCIKVFLGPIRANFRINFCLFIVVKNCFYRLDVTFTPYIWPFTILCTLCVIFEHVKNHGHITRSHVYMWPLQVQYGHYSNLQYFLLVRATIKRKICFETILYWSLT